MSVELRQLSPFARSFLDRVDGIDSPPAIGPAWLSKLRAAARDHFAALDLPHARLEEWRHTPLRDLREENFAANGNAAHSEEAVERSIPSAADTIELAFVDGVFRPSERAAPPAGVVVGELQAALTQDAGLLEADLGRLASTEKDSFTALNTAGFAAGCFVHVAAGVRLARPIHLKFLQTGKTSVLPRVLILAETASSATVIEEHGGANAYLNAVVVEIQLHDNADWRHLRIQHESAASRHFNHCAVRLGAGASFRSDSVVLSGGLVRNRIDVELAGENSSCHLGGLIVAAGEQIVDHHTQIRHLVPHTRSVERFRHVLDERARGVFCGLVHVAVDAQKTDAEQNNRNLLLSDDAQMNTMPQLEIYADDVRCSHGATLGQLDEDALFYLRARGIDSDSARSMLVRAFVEEIIDELPLPALRDWVRATLARRLPGEAPLLEIS
ncbi:MAG TPA: Fe-S cluster assembly protein SufD [Candidatus Krumholzibacteria bacterium]